MTVRELLRQVREVRIPKKGFPVEETAAREILGLCDSRAEVKKVDDSGFISEEGALFISVVPKGLRGRLDEDWVSINVDINQCLWLLSSKPYFLYTGLSYLVEDLLDEDAADLLPWM